MLKETFRQYLFGQQKVSEALGSAEDKPTLPHYVTCFTGNKEEDARMFLTVEQTATIKLQAALNANQSPEENTLTALKELVQAIKSIE